MRVQQVETSGNSTVYDKTITLKTLPATDWYGFYFGDFIYKDNAVFADLPPYKNSKITLRLPVRNGELANAHTAPGKLETVGYCSGA